MPFETFLKQRTLEPLGMVDTDFGCPRKGRALRRELRVLILSPGLKVIDPPVTSHYTDVEGTSEAGVVSTLAIYLRFAQMLLKGRAGRVRCWAARPSS